MAKLRAAIIGLGRMGSTFDDELAAGGTLFRPYCHAPAYQHHRDIELVCGADPHEEQRALFGARWGVAAEHLYPDYQQMLADERPDIVSVTTTARLRPAIVQDVARAGAKIIWAEKPISLTLEDADAMVRVCREHGVTFAVNCARRWMDGYSEARNLIDRGVIGDVLQVTSHYPCGLSGNGSHLIDTVRYLAGGEVQWVFGDMESDAAAATDDDITGNGYLAFDNGVRAFLRTMPCGATSRVTFQVIGTGGELYCQERPPVFELIRPGGPAPYGDGYRAPSPKLLQPQPATYPIQLPPVIVGTGIRILDDLLAAAAAGRDARVCGADGLKALEIAIAMRESHRRGGVRVELPLADRSLQIVAGESQHDGTPARIRRERAGRASPR